MTRNDQQSKLSVLLQDYQMTSQEMNRRLGTNERNIALGGTILGVAFTVALKYNANKVLIFVPLALFCIAFYATFNVTMIMSLAGYRRFVEKRINDCLGENILIWDSIARKKVHPTFSLLVLNLIYFLIICLTSYFGLTSAWSLYGPTGFWLLLFILAGLLVSLAFALRELLRAFDIAYETAAFEADIAAS